MIDGILVIVGLALTVAFGGLIIHLLSHRFGRSRKRAMERHPAPPGRVGRSSEFREER